MSDLLPQIGDLFAGKYRLNAKLGEGGYGVVFKAFQDAMGRDVAIKMLRPEANAKPDEVERFRREVFHASGLRHPNTITLYDYGQTAQGLFYIVMEYLRGMNLRFWIKQHGPLPHDAALDTVEQILRSLREAHAQGIIHRDLKPENIFVTELSTDERLIKVLDFGLSKAVSGKRKDARALTKQGQAFGTPQYMSPEQACAMPLTSASDIYAMGLLTYEMLTGKAAFTGKAPVDILLKQVHDPLPELPSPLRGTLLETFIVTCTQKPVEDRFADAREALEWLVQEKERRRQMDAARTRKKPDIIAPPPLMSAPSPEVEASRHSTAVAEPWFDLKGSDTLDTRELELRLAQLPLVGRRQELERLLRWSQQALSTGGVLWITGEPGVGKSRLVDEWLRHMEMHAVITLHGQYRDGGPPMEGLREALSPIIDVGTHAPPGTLVDIEDTARLLQLLHPQELGDEPSESGSQWAFAAIQRPVYAMARQRPTVLVLEGLQWADSFTQTLVERWMEDMATRTLPLLLVFVQRGDEHAHLATVTRPEGMRRVSPDQDPLTYAQTIHMRPLSDRHAQQLLDDLLPFTSLLKQRILETGRGNPLYLIQIVRYLVEEQLLERRTSDRTWDVLAPLQDQPLQLLPPTLETLLMQRIHAQIDQHRLGAALRAIFLRALLIGQRFEIRLLRDTLRLEGRGDLDTYLDDAIEVFSQSNIFAPKVLGGRPTLELTYAMLRQPLLEQHPWEPGESQRLHAIIARAKIAHYEQRETDDVSAHAHEIARHFIEAGDRDRGFKWWMRAARAAEQLQDFRQSLNHLRHAAQLLDPDLDPNGEHLLEIRLMEGRMHRALGEFGPAEDALRSALAETRRVGDLVGEALTGEALAGVLTLITRYDEALATYAHIGPLYEQFQDQRGLARCDLGRAEVRRFQGRYEEAKPGFEQAMQRAFEAGDLRLQARGLYGMGQCTFASGDLIGARDHFKSARKRAETLGDVILRSDADLELALIAIHSEHIEQAISMAKQALEAKNHIGDTLGQAYAHLILGVALRRTLRLDQARFHAQRARTINERLSHLYGIAKAMLLDSEILWMMGKPDQAIARLHDALKTHEEVQDAHGIALCHIHRALCEVERGAPQAAGPPLDAAARLIGHHALQLYTPMTLCVRGMALEQQGEFEDAISYHDEALQRAERAQRLDTACLAIVNIAKLRILLGDLHAARKEVPIALARAESLGHINLLMFALTLQALLARLDRDADALASSVRRLRVLHDHASGVELHIPARVAALAHLIKHRMPSERAFPIILAAIELLRALGAEDRADGLARQIMPSADTLALASPKDRP